VDVDVDSRVCAKAPLRILCQTDQGSCAACCGTHNFQDRSPQAMARRLLARTVAVRAAWPNEEALAAARDRLLAAEAPEILSPGIKVCPYAGYVEGGVGFPVEAGVQAVPKDARVGCLLHPTRHPQGADLRHLAVHPKEVCAGHFCAPHDWLRDPEKDLAATVPGPSYAEVVTNAALVKAVAEALVQDTGVALSTARLQAVPKAVWATFWETLTAGLPFGDPDPLRFGAIRLRPAPQPPPDAEPAPPDEVLAPPCLPKDAPPHSRAERAILQACGTRPLDAREALQALLALRAALAPVRAALTTEPG
jgi:hypothetical protein